MSSITYSDDTSILDSDALWRRIPYLQWVFDHNLGRVRPSTGCFDDSSDGTPMSVDLARISRDPHRNLPSDFALAEFTAGLARSRAQIVCLHPQEGNHAHTYVAGKKTDGVKKALARKSTWAVLPPAPSVTETD